MFTGKVPATIEFYLVDIYNTYQVFHRFLLKFSNDIWVHLVMAHPLVSALRDESEELLVSRAMTAEQSEKEVVDQNDEQTEEATAVHGAVVLRAAEADPSIVPEIGARDVGNLAVRECLGRRLVAQRLRRDDDVAEVGTHR